MYYLPFKMSLRGLWLCSLIFLGNFLLPVTVSSPINSNTGTPTNSRPGILYNQYRNQIQSYIPLNVPIPSWNGNVPNVQHSVNRLQQYVNPQQFYNYNNNNNNYNNNYNNNNRHYQYQRYPNFGLSQFTQYIPVSFTTENPNTGGAANILLRRPNCQSGCYYDSHSRSCRCSHNSFTDY